MSSVTIDAQRLDAALQAKSRLESTRQACRVAERDFQEAVRRLHEAGASTKEAAKSLDISEEAACRILGITPKSGLLKCGICGLSQKEVRKIIAGPGVYICDGCVALATALLAGDADGAGRVAAAGPADRCSFCGKSAEQVNAMAAGPDIRICSECLDLCHEIIEEEGF